MLDITTLSLRLYVCVCQREYVYSCVCVHFSFVLFVSIFVCLSVRTTFQMCAYDCVCVFGHVKCSCL